MKTVKTHTSMGGTGKLTLSAALDVAHVAILRERLNVEVERLRGSLDVWIEDNADHAHDAAVSIAMLETALDHYIELLGETDAFELIETAFRRRAKKFRQSLQ